MLKIAVYGKGGIGKSTTVSNLSAALASMGYRVMQIGCDPKADSVCNLMGGKKIPTILEKLREGSPRLEEIVFTGEGGVLCAEAGGPIPGRGCAGKGIVTAFELLDKLEAFSVYQPDVVLYDVLGDVVCGGFAMPLRGGYADVVLIVTSGEKMSLYAAGNICAAVAELSQDTDLTVGGLLLNQRNIEGEWERVESAAQKWGVPVFGCIPRSPLVQKAEEAGRTVVAQFPDSDQSQVYRAIAQKLWDRWAPCYASASEKAQIPAEAPQKVPSALQELFSEKAGESSAQSQPSAVPEPVVVTVTHGLPDSAFEREYAPEGIIPMTKSEVRSICLSKLQLTEDAICWDIGAGTGSVAIEMALQAKKGQVYAVERMEAAADLIRRNSRRFSVENLTVVTGSAPQACRDLPAPTHVFVGGSSGNIQEILALLLEKNPQVCIVATAVSLESVGEWTACLSRFDQGEAVSISVARSKEAGRYHLMTGQNPVYIFTMKNPLSR